MSVTDVSIGKVSISQQIHPHGLADASQVRVIDDVAGQSTGNALADIAVELDLMRTLLHRATLAAAPALAGLRRIPHRV
jgi:hypothetical protein